MLVGQGLTFDRVRDVVVDLTVAEERKKAGTAVALVEPAAPRCPRCRRPLDEFVAYVVLEVPPLEGEGEARKVTFALCRSCGNSLGALP